jgi:hypothetical protein
MNVYLSGALWVVGAALVGGGSAYLVRRYGLDEGRPDNNDAAGQVFTIVGGLHAVLVAFVLISLFDAVSTAQDGAYQEADGLVSASWALDSLPGPVATQVRELSTEYANTVINQEWPQMRAGHAVTGPGWRQLEQLHSAVAMAPADEDWQQDRKDEAESALSDVYQARQDRLISAAEESVGAVLWFALILGSVISSLMPNLFGGTRAATHVIIVATLAGTITLLLFAIYQLQNPFSGGANLQPDAFRSALARLG